MNIKIELKNAAPGFRPDVPSLKYLMDLVVKQYPPILGKVRFVFSFAKQMEFIYETCREIPAEPAEVSVSFEYVPEHGGTVPQIKDFEDSAGEIAGAIHDFLHKSDQSTLNLPAFVMVHDGNKTYSFGISVKK